MNTQIIEESSRSPVSQTVPQTAPQVAPQNVYRSNPVAFALYLCRICIAPSVAQGEW